MALTGGAEEAHLGTEGTGAGLGLCGGDGKMFMSAQHWAAPGVREAEQQM